jgi:Domain of unknown function (DUF3560)
MTYRERRERKAERLREWAESRDRKADAARGTADSIMGAIPPGQPILAGHHSQRRHERDLARLDGAIRATVEHASKADDMRRRADSIDAAAEHAIYSDDPDAAERLRERVAELERRREDMKARNAAIPPEARRGAQRPVGVRARPGDASPGLRAAQPRREHQPTAAAPRANRAA